EKDPDKEAFVGVVANSFLQAYVTQEWLMKNIKLNFVALARDNFFTYATWQNFLGGVSTDLMTPTDRQDQIELTLIDDCDGLMIENHYAPRTVYHDMTLMDEIFEGDKKYLKTTTTMYSGNPNLPPTVFIKESSYEVYFVYSNTRPTTQTFYIDPNDVKNFYSPAEISLHDHTIMIYSVDAEQPYSTSGKSEVFNINTFYNSCNDPFDLNAPYENRFEITETSEEENTGTCSGGWGITDGVCVKVPANSCGYFMIEMEPYVKLGVNKDFYRIYPNPASTFFTLLFSDAEYDNGEKVNIDIYSASGSYQKSAQINAGEKVDISDLPVGVYQLVITQNNLQAENEMLVKMK
ncbi:MAG: T9SS type A sorting domain-containing protein, partial [Chitinophagales bacterium]